MKKIAILGSTGSVGVNALDIVAQVSGMPQLVVMFAGAVLLSALSTAVSILGIPPFFMNIFRGGFIIVAVVLDAVISRLRPRLM